MDQMMCFGKDFFTVIRQKLLHLLTHHHLFIVL